MKTRISIIFGLISLVFTACDRPIQTMVVPTSPPGPSQTWIDAPLPNSILPLLPYKLVFHGASFVGVTEFEIKVNGNIEAVVPSLSSSSGGAQYGTLFLGEYTWTPPSPGVYLILVRAKGNGVFSLPDQVTVTVAGDFASSSPTPTVGKNEQCTFTALINQFCNRGEGYDAIDNFVAGQSAQIIGRSTDGLFWYVIGPNYGEVCTVLTEEGFGEVSDGCETMPRFTPMPTPIPTESPLGCTVRQAGGTIICVYPCPAGANPGESCRP